MKNETQEQGREGEIDHFYGQPKGSRRLEIEKLRFKLYEKKSALVDATYKKYKASFDAIKADTELLPAQPGVYFRQLHEQRYFDLLSCSQEEHNQIDESPLGRIVSNLDHTHELFDRSDHENMLDASDSLFRDDSDPVLSTVLDDSVYRLNVPGNTKRERKKARHRSDIARRCLQKHVYERYLSESVGKPITIEQYEREFGFLSDVTENTKNT